MSSGVATLTPMDGELASRIGRRVEIMAGSGCWIWQGYCLPNGYGKMTYAGRRAKFVHRMSFEAYNGPIPEGLVICHRCDTPSCVNPGHLFSGTQRDNANDMVRKKRSYVAFEKEKTHCKRGHELAGENLRLHRTGRRQCLACHKITRDLRSASK